MTWWLETIRINASATSLLDGKLKKTSWKKQKRRKKNLKNRIKNQSDRLMKEKNKHGGARQESMRIKRYADQWCKDNGYPIQKRYYVYRSKKN